jgi:IS605 OrfB family transposase
MAKHLLSRLPGLRILSVDLGHRFAAACTVWHTLSRDEMLAACAAANASAPAPEALWTRLKDAEGKHLTTYRRIGPDTRPDGSAHPAPWARLDRQFAIRLQGEDRPARGACSNEIQEVIELEKALGFARAEDLPKRIDELMAHAVRIARLGLRRHGDRARIGFALTAEYQPLPGDRKEVFAKQPGDSEERVRERHQNHVLFVQDALLLWHELATSARWDDPAARELWNQRVLPVLKSVPLPFCPRDKKEYAWKSAWQGLQSELQRRTDEDDDLTLAQRKQRKTEREIIRDLLQGVAELLIADCGLRAMLHALWAARWQQDDGAPARVKTEGKKTQVETPASGWHAGLRWLNRMLLPRESDRPKRNIQDVGGLSLTRISTIRSLYQLQKAFFTRLRPDGRNEVAREAFADDILRKMERMREQRVKQLASRIAEAALGVGIEQPRSDRKQPKRPGQLISSPRFGPCHAVVIEDLTNYRPDDLRTRGENRRLMDWSAAQVKQYLSDACHLHGLHVRQVSAHFTSRQDSRTGAPGLRCAEVEIQEFLNSRFWKSEVARARRRLTENDASLGKPRAYDSYITDLEQHCRLSGSIPAKALIPRAGRELFVSVQEDSPAAKGLDADLNAAANIGLKALLDPDWEGRWWYVPCDSETSIPDKNRVAGSRVFESLDPLRGPQTNAQNGARRKRAQKKQAERGVVNLFRDISARPLTAESAWKTYTDYWSDVEVRVMQRLRAMYGISPRAASASAVSGGEDVPF